MTAFRNASELFDASKVVVAGMAHNRPEFHQRYIVDMSIYDRVLTKIGLNLVAKLLGLELIRSSAFDTAVAYAREGIGRDLEAPARNLSTDHVICSVRHSQIATILALLPVPRSNGSYKLAFMARLYGGPAEVFLLAEFDGPIAELKRPVILLVDYINHKIERPTIEESEKAPVQAIALNVESVGGLRCGVVRKLAHEFAYAAGK